jgi:hypothetical protein
VIVEPLVFKDEFNKTTQIAIKKTEPALEKKPTI